MKKQRRTVRELIQRDRINRRIRDAARYRIVLLIAGAGYGKSEALSQYWATLRKPKVLLRVPKESANLPAFLQVFAAACTRIAPGMSSSISSAWMASQELQNPPHALAIWAATHLRDFRGVIALDDFENVGNEQSEQITWFVDHLIRSLPHAKWIIATRQTGALPVAKWIAQELVGIPIDGQELAFTAAEAWELARLYGSHWDYEMLRDEVEALWGWPFPIALEIRSSTRVDRQVRTPDRTLTFHYLAEQVWNSLSEIDQRFLEHAAILPRLTIKLAVAAGFDHAHRLARSIADRLAFCSFSNGQFSLHALFRDFVLDQLLLQGNAIEASLRLRCATILAADGSLGDALELVIQVGDAAVLQEFIEHRELTLMNARYRDVVKRALNVLRHCKSHGILFLRAVCAHDDGHLRDAVRLGRSLLERSDLRSDFTKPLLGIVARALIMMGDENAVEELPWQTIDTRDADSGALVLLESVRTWFAAYRGATDVVQASMQKTDRMLLKLEPADQAFVLHAISGAAIWLCWNDDGIRYAKAAMGVAMDAGLDGFAARCATNAVVALANREFAADGIKEAMDNSRALCERSGLWSVLRYALEAYGMFTAWSGLEFETDCIVEEIQRLPRPVNDRHNNMAVALMHAYVNVMRSRINQAFAGLSKIVSESAHLEESATTSAFYHCDAALLHAYTAALSGDYTVARAALDRYQGLERPGKLGLGMQHREVVAMLALSRFTQASRLARAIAGSDPATRPLDRWYLLLLRDRNSALVRREVQLYRQTPGIGLAARMLEQLLTEWGKERTTVGSLTRTEHAVLQMLGMELSNKEIAAARSSTEATVKVHVGSILRKLGADSRRSAVNIAREHGVIT